MPLYEYVSPHGSTVLMHRPVEQRDHPVEISNVTFRRRTVPSRISIGTGARPETQGSKILRGYRAMELAGQLTDNPNYLDAATVKRAAAMPDVPDPDSVPAS